jgi:hypothetical protein
VERARRVRIQLRDVADRDKGMNTDLVLSQSPSKCLGKNGKLLQANVSHRFDLSQKCPGRLK